MTSAACSAARCHRANEDTGIEEMLGEANSIAEQGAARERARGVDREHADVAVGGAQKLGQGADDRALSNPRRAGKPDDASTPGARIDLAHELPARRVV